MNVLKRKFLLRIKCTHTLHFSFNDHYLRGNFVEMNCVVSLHLLTLKYTRKENEKSC